MKKLFLILFLTACVFQCFAQTIQLWDGETNAIGTCTFYNGTADNSTPYNGQWAFKANMNQWQPATINLKCQDTWRKDLSNYSEIRFYIKSDSPGAKLKFGLTGWPFASQMVEIGPYVENGPIDNQYKLVKIPLAVLKTADYQLQTVEYIRFETSEPNLVFYADVFQAVDLSPAKVDSVEWLSNQAVRLNISESYEMSEVLNLNNYFLISEEDTDFSAGLAPEKIGRHFFVNKFKLESTNPVVKNELFLVFNKKLKNGKFYTLTVKNVKDRCGNNFVVPQSFSFIYNDQQLIKSSVKVNQVGYFSGSEKYAYIGNYLGDAGHMPLFPLTFEIRNAENNQMVYSGIPDFRGNDPVLSGEQIFECDFTNLSTSGTYYVYVPGIGRSFNFDISNKVMDKAYFTAARGLFYQRCGTELQPPYADAKWSHAACHLNDGYPHTSWLNSSLYNGESMNEQVKMPFGWHDAGDYGKYATPGISALYYLLSVYQFFPEKFGDGELNLPESSNGIPDILDEAHHELKWLLNMQAADGGVYERVTTLQWPTSMPENDLASRYISEKTTNTTGQFAAIMAMAYRLYKPFWPGFAKYCLERAKLAMTFLGNHPSVKPEGGYLTENTGMGGGAYPDPEGDLDERAWAAAELYKATGELSYRNMFDTYWAAHTPLFGWNPFQHHQIPASIAYATTPFPVDENKVTTIKQGILNYADNTLIPRINANFYRSACRTDVVAFLGFGAYGQSSHYSWDLMMAYYFSGLDKYRKYALLSLDVQLGNNPQNMSYITGIGSKYPKDPLHHPSRHDGVEEPVPGIPVYGPSAHISMSNPYNAAVQSTNNLYPAGQTENDPYPVLRRFYDISSNSAMSEFNVIDMTLTTAALGFFKSPPVTSKVLAKPIIQLQYFKAEKQQSKVLLTWETAYEQQITNYTIDRAADGLNYQEIGKLNSLGNSDTAQVYQFLDGFPITPVSYYRLRISDIHGNSIYSDTLKISFTAKRQLVIYPNPVADKISVSITGSSSDPAILWNALISNFEGRVVWKAKGNLDTINIEINKSVNHLNPGVYVLQLRRPEEELEAKFIKK